MKKITLLVSFIALMAFPILGIAQKVAIVGMNHTTPDGIAIVALEDLPSGETFYYTDSEYSDASNAFASGEGVVQISLTSAMSKGNIIVLSETSMNVLSFSCSNGCTGSATVISGNFAIATDGEGHYLYSDSDTDPTNGVTEIFCVVYTGSGEAPSVNGGSIPSDENPTNDFPNAIVVDGFPDSQPDFTEYDPTSRGGTVTREDLENPSNWNHGQPNGTPSQTPFADIQAGNNSSPCEATLEASDTEVCLSFSPPDTIDLTGSSTPDPTGSGTFSLGVGSDIPVTNPLVDNGNGTGTFNPIAAGAGTYILVYTHTNSTGCVAEAQETIVVYPEADISITGPSSVAEDGAPINFQGLLGGAATSGVVAMLPSPPSGSFSGSAVTAIATYTPAIGDAGDYNIQFTYVDSDNNSCINILRIPFTVEPIGDTTPPEITCPPDQILIADSNCNVLVPDYTGLVTATDNVTALPIITQSPPAGSTFNGAGTTVIVFTATDDAGNSVTCNMGLTIEDNKAPIPICINGLTVELDATTGLGTIFASDFIASPTVDACGPVTYLISRVGSDVKSPSLTLGCEDEEITLVRIWAEDVNGNSDYCETYIQVDKTQFNCPDESPPVIDCTSVDGARNNDAGQCGFTMPDTGFDPTATDNVGVVSLTNDFNNTSSLAGETFPVGTTTVIWTAVDAEGNTGSCSLDIVITDNEAPSAIVQNVIIELDDQGQVSANPFLTGALISTDDNCGVDGGVGVTGPNTFTCANIGENPQRIFVRDIHGNQTPYDVVVTVTDPLGICVDITCPPDITIKEGESTDPSNTGLATATGGAGDVTITFSDIVATDGTITRTWTATDEQSNNSSCVQIITVDPLSTVKVTKDVIGVGSNPDDQFYFFYNTSIPNELGNFYLSESGINSPEQEGGSFSFNGAFLIQVREENLPDEYSISDIQFTSEKGTSSIRLKTNNEIQVDVASGDNVSIKFINTYVEPCQVSVDIQPQDPAVCEFDPLNLSVEASGTGTLSYQWQFAPPGTSSFIDVLSDSPNVQVGVSVGLAANGNQYRVIVTSDNGTPNDPADDCSVISDVATLTVNPLPEVEITGKDSYCHDGNGVELDAGAGFTSYLWSPGGQTTRTITALEGSYTVTVTNEFGCETTSEAFIVTNNEPLTCSIEQDILTTDHLTEDGVATVTPIGGKAPFTYLWDNGETTQTATTLTYGIHTVTVTDTKGCETTCQIDVAKELYCWTNLIQNVSYKGGNDGSAKVLGNGGYRPYSFMWEDGTIGDVNSSLTAGIHEVTITDSTGATSTCTVTISEPNEGNCTDLTCSIDQDVLATNHQTPDGVATVYPTGGSGQYTYLWDNGETGQTATTLTYGIHTVTVTDTKGCETTCQIDVAKELYCWTNLIQNVSYKGGNDGSAKVLGNGGYRPYSFMWEDGTIGDVNSSLTAGIHEVTITDSTGATSTCTVTISEPNEGNCTDLTCSIDQDVLATNHQTPDGVATVYPTGGSGQYTYLWDNGETGQTATTLTYGIHTVTVTDTKGCETTCQIDVAKELYCWTNLIQNVSYNGGSDGSARVSGNGGYRPYTFEWEDGSTGEVNDHLTTGTHYVTITDATGATSVCSVHITEPNSEEVCDGIDNDGDGDIDEGFDQDGDGIADCYDKCPNGDDSVDEDDDGIPDACDDVVCIKPEMPQTACYETAIWKPDNCRWDIVGEQPEMPETECYETAVWNAQTCSWDIVGEQPEMPETECYETAVWNAQTCSWDIADGQPEMPETECYETAVWNAQTCSWDIVGEQPEMPETECYETAVWNAQTCSWDIVDGQPEMPVTECYETAVWNAQTCSWDIVGEQPEMPETECYETATWNPDTCSWDVEGDQPLEPETECYQTATWNPDTCEWEIEGEQPEMPETLCYETAIWNPDTCEWDIVQDGDPSCAGGSIDKCETAFAMSSGSSTCFEDIPNFKSPRWGWTNEFPSINGTYQMELYAAAGQCDISKGALVGSVEVVYSNGSVDVTVSVLNGYKMTEAQLHVGTDLIPTNPNNGNLTVAPGQYDHKYEPGSDFTNYTFDDIGTGDADIFYVILHAEVCPMDNVSKYRAPTLELSGYPVPFKEDFTLVVISPREMKSELSLYDGIGKRVQTFGNYYLKKGRNEIGLRTNELPAGMYYVYVTTGSGKQILKVLRRP